MDENVKTCPLCNCDILLEDCIDFHSVHVCRWCIYEIAKDYGRRATPLVRDDAGHWLDISSPTYQHLAELREKSSKRNTEKD